MKKIINAIILTSFLALVFTACQDENDKIIGVYGDEPMGSALIIYKKADMDPRLKRHPQAVLMYGEAGSNPEAAFDLGNFYKIDLRDYDEAIVWFTRAYEKDYVKAANQIALTYEKKKDYDNAIKWYEISIAKGITESYINIAILYHEILKDKENAIKYYNLDIGLGSFQAVKNMANLYSEYNEPVKSSAYFVSLLEYGSDKNKLLSHLKNTLKYSDETIKKGYELQLTMPGLKYRYKGGI